MQHKKDSKLNPNKIKVLQYNNSIKYNKYNYNRQNQNIT